MPMRSVVELTVHTKSAMATVETKKRWMLIFLCKQIKTRPKKVAVLSLMLGKRSATMTTMTFGIEFQLVRLANPEYD